MRWAQRVQANGEDGSLEMGKLDGMLCIPAGDMPGWDQRLLSGFNTFLLPNPIAEELGSTARLQSHCRQTPKAA